MPFAPLKHKKILNLKLKSDYDWLFSGCFEAWNYRLKYFSKYVRFSEVSKLMSEVVLCNVIDFMDYYYRVHRIKKHFYIVWLLKTKLTLILSWVFILYNTIKINI